MRAPAPAGAAVLTRRQALQAGGASAAAALVFLHPWATAVARAADGSADVPKHLLRSTWRDLSDRYFRAGDVTLKFEGVADLAAAPNVASLQDSEDAFSLVFSGPVTTQVPEGPVTLRNSELGTFEMYVGPSTGAGADREAVVNRVLSNKESRRTPPRAAPQRPAEDRAPEGASEAAPDPGHTPKPKRVIRKVDVRRNKKGVKVVVELRPSADIEELAVWLKRDGKVLAAASRRVHGKRVAINLKPHKRLRKGLYEVDVMALDDVGEQTIRRERARLR